MASDKVSKKSRNVWVWVGIGLTIGIILLFWYLLHKSQTPTINNLNTAPGSGSSGSGYTPSTFSDVVNPDKILHKGDNGLSVQELQKQINLRTPVLMTKLVEDGAYGSMTDTAVKLVSGDVLSSSNNNVTINAVKAIPIGGSSAGSGAAGTAGSSAPAVAGDNVYSLLSGAAIYEDVSDWFPYRYAGFMEYIGKFKEFKYSWTGTKYVITTEGHAIDSSYAGIKS